MAMRLCAEDLGERSVLDLALRFAACPRLLRITRQAHVPATMAQRLPRAVVVMPTRAELPQPLRGRIKCGHMGVRHHIRPPVHPCQDSVDKLCIRVRQSCFECCAVGLPEERIEG